MKNKHSNELYEFAGFRLDAGSRRLTVGGEEVRLTPKEIEILLLLVESGGRTVEKDELLRKVWKDTFVEEGTLTRNVSWLRKKLGAHLEGSVEIVETVPKRGYRFLPEVKLTGAAPVTVIIEEQIIRQVQVEETVEITPTAGFAEQSIYGKAPETSAEIDLRILPAPARQRRFSPIWMAVGLIILFIAAFAVYRADFSSNGPRTILASKIAPFSGLPGREDFPAFAPDGRQMVFSWDGGVDNGNLDIYIKLVGAGEPIRLIDNAADEINPVFSPDGKFIAFVRLFPTHNEIILVSALGGAERRIYDKASYASLSFSPDGKNLAAAELDLSNGQAGIFTINLETGEKTRMTNPQAPAVDHTPRFSPDGKNLAFIRYFSSFQREILVVPAAGGEPRQVTSDNVRIYGLAWNADGRNVFFTSFRQTGQLNLWQVSLNGGDPQLIPTGGRNLQSLAISPNGRTIAFVEETEDENIWKMEEKGAWPLIRSTRADHSQQFSPDGSQIVFASDRTGNYEIWLADADGKNQRQLTDSKASAGSPRFSPDGKFIAYDAQFARESEIYVVSTNGGSAPRRLTDGGKNNSLPAWSQDGEWIFFLSNRSGGDQIWKMPAASSDSAEAVQITKDGAFDMFAAPDGKEIIYSKGPGKGGLWRVGIDGSNERPIPELAQVGNWRSWCVAGNGVYYTAHSAQPPFRIKFFDFATRQIKEITSADRPPPTYYSNLSASGDGKKILYARRDQSASSIMLAELE